MSVSTAADSTGSLPHSRRVQRRPSPAVRTSGVFQHRDVTLVSGHVRDRRASHQPVYLPPDRRRPPASAAQMLGHQADHATRR